MSQRIDLREAWNRISPHYQAHNRIPTDFVHYGPHCPNEDQLQLIGEVRGKRVLEIGCGGGQCSIAFAKRGAIVTGVDLSDEQIAFARKLAEAEGVAVAFLRRSMEDLSPIADHIQDVVFSAYAFEYLETWDRCLAEARRVLAPDGLLVFSVDHPFFACIAGDSFRINQSYHDMSLERWNWDYPAAARPPQAGQRRGLRAEGALDAGVSAPFEAWHRKVGVMFRSLRDAGFQVLDILEPEPVESGSGQDTFGDYYSPARQRMVPATIIWRARPLGCGRAGGELLPYGEGRARREDPSAALRAGRAAAGQTLGRPPGQASLRRKWNRISPFYQAEHNIPTDFVHYGPHCPNEDELQLIGDVRGKRVLEVGCGGGQCSIAFAKRGAVVTGVDLSDDQIEFARGLAARNGVVVSFLQCDAQDLSAIPDASQEIVFSAYALQFVEHMGRCFSEVARVLRPCGLFVFSLDHPFWYCLPDGELVVESSYFDSAYWYEWEQDGLSAHPRMTEYHRTIGEWHRLLCAAGFEVLDMVEPGPVEVGSGQDWGGCYAPERQRMVPATIIWKARKP